jgi:hypothetical protein
MHGKILFRSLGVEMKDKFFPQVLSPSIRVQDLDFGVELGGAPCFVVFIGLEGIALLCEEVKVRKACSVIRKCDVVTLSTLRFNWRRTPQVTVYLPSKDFGTLALPLLQN